MPSSDEQPSDFVPLTPESLALYGQFWAQIGIPTTTQPPMDFCELKRGALQWGDRLSLPPGILEKFRQRIAAAQSDQEVFAVMKDFQQFATPPAEPPPSVPPMPDASQPAAARKAYRSMTVSMSTRAIELVNQGLSNRAIAAELGVSERSVKRNIVVQRARAALKARRGEALPGRKLKSGDIEAYSDFDGDPER